MDSVFLAGLDLGQASDYSALTVVEKFDSPDGFNRYDVRKLWRWPLGTPYPKIVDDCVTWFSRHPIRGSTVCVDNTGVGRAVTDIFRQQEKLQANIVPITIVNAFSPNRQKGEWHVPKKDLIGVLQVLWGCRPQRIRMVLSKPWSPLLEKELNSFRVKVNRKTGHESFEAWRARDHDDLVLALALPLWYGERVGNKDPRVGQFRIIRSGSSVFGPGKAEWRILVCSRASYESLAIEEKHVFISVGNVGDSAWEKPANSEMLDSVRVCFLDATPEERESDWHEMTEANVPVCDSVFNKHQGKAVWTMLLRKRTNNPQVIVVQDDGGKDRRGISLALAVADVLGRSRNAIRWEADLNWNLIGKAPNEFIYGLMTSARNSVAG